MFDVTGIEEPKWPNPMLTEEERAEVYVHNVTVLSSFLARYEDALSAYSGKSEKSTAKVEKVIEAIGNDDPEAVRLAENAMDEIRAIILDTVRENVNTTYLLFSALDDVKKSIGSWRADVSVTVSNDDDDNDRDLIAEYEALDKAKTMIEGTFNAFGINVMDLPEKYRAQKSERVEGKNVPTGDWYLKFPGKLISPLNENESGKVGKTAVSMTYTWECDGTVIGKASWPYLARYCSTHEVIIGTDDLVTSVKAKYGDSFAGNEVIEVRTPRGVLTGTKVKK